MLLTSARLLRLLSLLQARGFWSGRELAERLEITERTVRRDVDRLRELGYPVNATSGVAGGYRLGAGASLPPLLLEDDEALAVALGLRNAAAGTVSGVEEAAVRALTKLEQVMPARLRKRVNALHGSVVRLQMSGPVVDAECLSRLASACRDRQLVTLRYGDKQARESERTVEPHGLVHAGNRWYLAAWDLGRQDWRTFRLDRIADCTQLSRRFTPRPIPEGSVAKYVSRSVGTNAYTHKAKVILHGPYELLSQRMSPLAGSISRLDEQRCLLETGAHSLALLGMFIAMLDVEFEVQEPAELAEHLRATAARLLRAAGS